jgi:carbon storage regulator
VGPRREAGNGTALRVVARLQSDAQVRSVPESRRFGYAIFLHQGAKVLPMRQGWTRAYHCGRVTFSGTPLGHSVGGALGHFSRRGRTSSHFRFSEIDKEETMLVLSRKPGNAITIGSDIEVTVLSVTNQRVKLGIRAPGEVRIVRGELLEDKRGVPVVGVGGLLEESGQQGTPLANPAYPR